MGSIEIPSVPELKKHQVMHDWMENTMKQCLTYKQTQRSLSERNRDLVDYKEKMEKELEDLTREKVESDMINIQKMKQLLNSKKRRLHKVMMERDSLLRQVVAHQAQDQSLKDQNEGSPIPIKKAASKKRGRPPASAASASASVSETQIDVARRKRMRTTPPPPSDQTEPSSSTQNVEKKDTKSSSSSSSGKKNGSRQDDPGGGSETDEDDAAGATVPGGKTAKIQKEATAIELDSDSDDYDSYIPKVRRAKIGNRSQKKRLARNASEEDDESGQSD
ncbi:hypothetical protein BDB00DRAFT_176742 [Zychaea mexicana]|uniref:uncharacterized protein n=1 Tax=Zychaea mexicana TaxID=64656 RepID=UPI0022FE2E3D|nr:uncharacterized protein BDB00DRAFT_176742 [Zychaea mexicana]KAI9495903.1 hypothetical protein BDB00DRAFT_176742 [Zychaea mexicana]